MIIRAETPEDRTAISSLIERAFGRADEARLVDDLRRDGDVSLSLVATEGRQIIGHVLLSRMTAPFSALGLAPLAVDENYRGRGVAAALIQAAIEEARAMQISAIFVLGNPTYYGRFGFRAHLAKGFVSPYAGPYLQVCPLIDPLPETAGQIAYAPAFSRLGA